VLAHQLLTQFGHSWFVFKLNDKQHVDPFANRGLRGLHRLHGIRGYFFSIEPTRVVGSGIICRAWSYVGVPPA
jgi:hypothetical protein